MSPLELVGDLEVSLAIAPLIVVARLPVSCEHSVSGLVVMGTRGVFVPISQVVREGSEQTAEDSCK